MLKKYLKAFTLLFILIIFYVYVANISLMPKNITLIQGEKLELSKLWGISLKKKNNLNSNLGENNNEKVLEASSIIEEARITETRQNRCCSKFV